MTVPDPCCQYAARTFTAKGHVVFGPTDSPSPQFIEPDSDTSDATVVAGTTGAAGTTVATVTVRTGRGLRRGREIATRVEPGAAPFAVAMTSIVVRPRWTVAVAVKTPFPTAAGRPWTSTIELPGLTVPRTVTRPAEVTVPAEGESSATLTILGAIATAAGASAGGGPQPGPPRASPGTPPPPPRAAFHGRGLPGSND